jgi:hypothetical protein
MMKKERKRERESERERKTLDDRGTGRKAAEAKTARHARQREKGEAARVWQPTVERG